MRRKARRGGAVQKEVTIARVGGRGDGLADHLGRPLYIAGALPGERARVEITGERAGGFKGRLRELLEASPERQEPPKQEKPVKQAIIPGAHQLDDYLPLLSGKNIAMVVNQTSMLGDTHLVDALLNKGI